MTKNFLNHLNIFSINRSCPVCKISYCEFNSLPDYYAQQLHSNASKFELDKFETLNCLDYSCTNCGASDRERLYAAFVDKWLKTINNIGSLQLLEIAPSARLTQYLREKPQLTVRTADLHMEGVDDKLDITEMSIYADARFDCIICSHVLEHVPDDLLAMREIRRILKSGGWAIVMVPIPLNFTEIDEDPDVTDISERWRRFGQDDHIRMYSRSGLLQRLEMTGFDVMQLGIEYFGRKLFKKYAISETSVLYVCRAQDKE
jgi:SAM-dependent methyltransferase